ncbi:T9SS type A sorting domain-containing protein, partial [Chitinophaga sp. GbtcB8]|uniref:T9SS type A sorting domain-containing protein n=1 Tax=Chitinophaga sp. GbtcB8 TaxID=2824753 RepID=UPI001C2FE72A
HNQVPVQRSAAWQQGSRLEQKNSEGKAVINRQLNGASHTLQLAPLPAGLYMQRVTNAGRQAVQKIIIE